MQFNTKVNDIQKVYLLYSRTSQMPGANLRLWLINCRKWLIIVQFLSTARKCWVLNFHTFSIFFSKNEQQYNNKLKKYIKSVFIRLNT